MNTKDTLSVLLEKIEELKAALDDKALDSQGTTENGFLKFNDKEIFQMPKTFRKQFRAQGCTAHVRKRTDGRYNCSYEIRYAKKPYNKHPISASGTTLEEAKARFIEKLNNYKIDEKQAAFVVPKSFNGFAMYWFDNFHKRKVSEKTYKKDLSFFTHYTKAAFGDVKLADVLPAKCQSFIDSFGTKGRLAEAVRSILNQIFNSAVNHGIIKLNPLGMCYFAKHERKHGSALTIWEEKTLLEKYANTEYLTSFAVALYTGLRPNEYISVRTENDFIVAKNSKRKNGDAAYKKIPISPMLAPYLSDSLKMFNDKSLTLRLKKVLPNHTLYDLRTTFQTRCTECGISEIAIGLFMGNSIGSELKKTYTDVSDEWLKREIEKLKY